MVTPAHDTDAEDVIEITDEMIEAGVAEMVEVKRSIAAHVESMHEQIMPVSADAAEFIMERVEKSFLLVPKRLP